MGVGVIVDVIIASDVVVAVDVVADVDVVIGVDVGVVAVVVFVVGVTVIVIAGIGVVVVAGAVAGNMLLAPDFPPPVVEIMSPFGADAIVIFPVQVPETKEPVLAGKILPVLSVSVLVPL